MAAGSLAKAGDGVMDLASVGYAYLTFFECEYKYKWKYVSKIREANAITSVNTSKKCI